MNRTITSGVVFVMLLLATTSARAYLVTLQFEAWATPASDICPAPCYQVRMFIEDAGTYLNREVQSLQMDVSVGRGAVPGELFTPPQENNGNSGPGTLLVRRLTGTGSQTRTDFLPWNLSSTVARSPAPPDFDARMVHAASAPFTVGSWKAILDAPGTTCFDDDPAACEFVIEAIARNRIYLGFFNVTRTEDTFEDPYCDHFGYCDGPPGTRYFEVRVGNITGSGELAAQLFALNGQSGYVPFLPEPSPVVLIAGVLALLVPLRIRR